MLNHRGVDLNKRAKELGFATSDDEIKPGDMYLAERNTGPHLLTCKKIGKGWIVPEEDAYFYDTWECIKVIGESK